MKRLSAFLLSLVFLFSLTGAGSPVLSGDPEPTSAPDGIVTEALFSLGTINGDVYENSYIGYGCKLEGWTYADAEYIATLNNVSGIIMSSDAQEALRNSGTYTDMMATSPDGNSSVNIQYQNIEKTYGPAIANYPLDKFLELVAPNMPSVLEQSGFQDVQVEAGSVPLGGSEHPGLIITSKFAGIPCYQKEACIRTKEYMIFVCVSSFYEDKTDELLTYFYPVSDGSASELVCFSPKEELDFAFRYSNPDWSYEIDSDGANFFKPSVDEEACRMLLLSQDMEGMADFSSYMLEIVFSTMKAEMEEQFDDIVFGETTDAVIGEKYSGRTMDMLISTPLLSEKMHAYMTAWTTDSRLYLLIAYTLDSELDDTLSMYSQLISSFETAEDYLARTGAESLDPAA